MLDLDRGRTTVAVLMTSSAALFGFGSGASGLAT
jgi:hypothetical protein